MSSTTTKAPDSGDASAVVSEAAKAVRPSREAKEPFVRAAARVTRASEWLVLLLLLAACVPPVLLRRESLTVVPGLNLLDGSWVLDICYKAARGVWLGRDVLFTYGPLYEWLSSAPSRWIGVSTGTILATSSMLPNLVSILAIFASARLLLPKVSPWRRALFLAAMLWTPPGIRVALCLFALAIFVRVADAVASRAVGIVLPALGAAMLCLACFLVSADAGLYAIAALLVSVAATAIAQWKMPGAAIRLCGLLLAAGVGLAILAVATNTVMASPLNFSYWKSSLTLMSGYRWFEAKSIMPASTWRMLGVLALGVVVFGAAWRCRESNGDQWTRRPGFLLAGFCLALLMMQSGLVRSDVIHVVNGIYPLVFLSGAILMGERSKTRWLTAMLPVIVVALIPLITIPSAESFPISVVKRAREIIRPNLLCPAGKQEFDQACFSPDEAHLFAAVSAYVDPHTRSGDPIVVFPYQNAFGVMSRRTVAGGVLQDYLVSGDSLTELDLAGLRKANPPLGLYFPEAGQGISVNATEGIYSYAMDGVPSFTRSPGIWFYLFRHYRAESSPMPGVLALERDDTRDQRLAIAEEKIADAPGTVRITKRQTWIDLGRPQWPAAGADFLKLRLLVKYAPGWKLRKPSALAVILSFADRSWQMAYVVVEPNQDSEVWVYPGHAKQMGGYFSSESSRWPTGPPPIRVKLLITPLDWISVSPESVSIEAVDAVRVRLK